MLDLSLGPTTDILINIALPLATLVVLSMGFSIAHRTLVRSVTPQVECFLRVRHDSTALELVIANFGLGSAHKVSVCLDMDEEDFKSHNVILDWRKTEVPFSIIEPGGSVCTFFGMAHQMLQDGSCLKPFGVEVNYQWQPFWVRRPRKETRCFKLDVRQFMGLNILHHKDKVAEALEPGLDKIANAIRAMSINPRLSVPRDRRSDDRGTLKRLRDQMPDLFAEMREDLGSNPIKREFILKREGSIYNAVRKAPLEYYFESHEDLADKVGLLVSEGLVTDITHNDVDRYVFSELLVEFLLESHQTRGDGLTKDD